MKSSWVGSRKKTKHLLHWVFWVERLNSFPLVMMQSFPQIKKLAKMFFFWMFLIRQTTKVFLLFIWRALISSTSIAPQTQFERDGRAWTLRSTSLQYLSESPAALWSKRENVWCPAKCLQDLWPWFHQHFISEKKEHNQKWVMWNFYLPLFLSGNIFLLHSHST